MSLLTDLIPFVSVIVTGILSLPIANKAWHEWHQLERVRRRTESDFAFKLAGQINDVAVSRYAEELAYAALIGDSHLTHAQRKRLLILPDAMGWIEKYMRVHNLIEVVPDQRLFEWRRPEYRNRSRRLLAKIGWFSAYLIAVALAFLPSWLWKALESTRTPGVATAFVMFGFLIFFMLLALYVLRQSVLISQAEGLVKTAAHSDQIRQACIVRDTPAETSADNAFRLRP